MEALTPLVEAFDRLGIAYYVGGSVSSSLHGMARQSQDEEKIGKSTRNLMSGIRESFCQRSINFRNSRSVGSHSRSIPGERRSCDTLPSKQAVAGSSPVSRSNR